jgi:outer membrane protein
MKVMPHLKRALSIGCFLALSAPLAANDIMTVHDLASMTDPQLRIARADAGQAEAQERRAKARYLPSLDATAGITRVEQVRDIAIGEASGDAFRRESWRLNLSQPIYNRELHMGIQQADVASSRAEANFTAAQQDFLLRVAETYFGVLRAEEALRFSEAEFRAIDRQFEQAQQRYEVGLIAITDVHEARASADAARARVISAQTQLDDAHEALFELTGRYFDDLMRLAEGLPLKTPDPADAQAWVDMAMANSPDIRAAQFAVDVEESGVDIAQAGHWPSLGFAASRSGADSGDALDASTSTSIGVNLSVPLYSGGGVRANVRAASLRAAAATERLEQVMRQTSREVRNNYRSVVSGISEVEAREQAVVSARSALEATQAGFEVGTRTIVDTLISQQNLFSAERQLVNARFDYLLNWLRLQRASGTLSVDGLVYIQSLLTAADRQPVDVPNS